MIHKLLAVLLFGSGCAAMLHANGFDPTPENPCGVNGLVCSGSYPHASCCTADLEECGGPDPETGFTTCPSGYCCSVNTPEPNPNTFGGKRKMRPQFSPR